MHVTVGNNNIDTNFILDDLDAAGEYDLAAWAEERLDDSDFRQRLGAQAEEEYEINGDPEAGYDISSAIVTALDVLKDREARDGPIGGPPPLAVDRSPRGRLSDLAERRQP